MVKRIFAALLIALLVGFPSGKARAQMKPFAVDGCAKLARVIYTEVSASALHGPGNSGPWLIDIGHGDISVCTHAAKTVSQAFTSAMMSAGISVNWPRNDDHRGDYCLSGFLSQCYPDRYPLSGRSFGTDAGYVQRSWAAVAQAVMREMYNPISSDEVTFRDNDLKLRLGLSLRSVRLSGRRR